MNDWLVKYDDTDLGNAECLYTEYKNQFCYIIEKGKDGLYYYDDGLWTNIGAAAKLATLAVSVLRRRHNLANTELNKQYKLLKLADTDETKEQLQAIVIRLKNIIRVTRTSKTNIDNTCSTFVSQDWIHISLYDFENVKTERLFNCKNGVVDLTTLELLPHDPKYRFTYKCKYPFIKDAYSELWQTQLKQTIGYYDQVNEYLQKAVGYTFTGLTNLESLFYIYGPPRSGKGLFVEIISDILDEHLVAATDYSTLSKARSESDDQGFKIAPMFGKRLITSSEPENGQRMNAAKIKVMTGNDKISAAFKYGQHFTFLPKFKIWITSNYKPTANLDDVAFWSRIRLIIFPNSFFGNEDFNRKEQLRTEENMIGILNWCLTGAYMFLQENKLDTPEILLELLQQAKDEDDNVAQWLKSSLYTITKNENDYVGFAELYSCYTRWCESIDEPLIKQREFSNRLNNKGCKCGARKYINGIQQVCVVGITR